MTRSLDGFSSCSNPIFWVCVGFQYVTSSRVDLKNTRENEQQHRSVIFHDQVQLLEGERSTANNNEDNYHHIPPWSTAGRLQFWLTAKHDRAHGGSEYCAQVIYSYSKPHASHPANQEPFTWLGEDHVRFLFRLFSVILSQGYPFWRPSYPIIVRLYPNYHPYKSQWYAIDFPMKYCNFMVGLSIVFVCLPEGNPHDIPISCLVKKCKKKQNSQLPEDNPHDVPILCLVRNTKFPATSSALRLQPAALQLATQRAMEQPCGPRALFFSMPDPGKKWKKNS